MNRAERRRARRRTGSLPVLDALLGGRIPGGCDDCDAYQELTSDGSGVYVLAVRHDASCPFLQGVTS